MFSSTMRFQPVCLVIKYTHIHYHHRHRHHKGVLCVRERLCLNALTHMRKTINNNNNNRMTNDSMYKPRLLLILINMSMCSDEPSSPVTLHYAHITSHFSHSLSSNLRCVVVSNRLSRVAYDFQLQWLLMFECKPSSNAITTVHSISVLFFFSFHLIAQ